MQSPYELLPMFLRMSLILDASDGFRYIWEKTMIGVSIRPPESRTILLVEDNDIYRQVVCAALTRLFPEWSILAAASLGEARGFIGRQKLDVVITDLTLPDGAGPDLVPSLAPDLSKGTKLVALSNESAGDVLGELKVRGYHGFVAKEHGVKALGEALVAVLGGGSYVSEPAA